MKNGRMEEWRNGGMEGWKNGRMEEWKNGRMEEWIKASIVVSDLGGLKSHAAAERNRTLKVRRIHALSRPNKLPSSNTAPRDRAPSRS